MKLLYCFFTVLFSFHLLGQTTTVPDSTISWGAEFPLTIRADNGYELSSTAADGYQLWLYPDRAPAALLNFDHTHRLQQTQTYRAFFDRPDIRFQGFAKGLKDTLACFEERELTTEQQRVFVSTFKNGQLGPLRPLLSFNLAREWRAEPISQPQNYRLRTVSPVSHSPNHQFFAYVVALRTGVTNTQSNYIIAVFDETGQLFWSKEVDKSTKAEYITALDVAVNDLGEVSILAQLHASRSFALAQEAPHLAGYRMQIFHCTADTLLDIDVFPNESIVPLNSRLHLPPQRPSEIMVAGIYQDPSTAVQTDGFYVKRINLAESRYTADYYPYARFTSTVSLMSSKTWRDRMVLRDYYQFADGSFGLVAELAYARSSPGPGRSPSYFSHQLLIPMFNPDGEMLRLASLDKYFINSNLSLSSYGIGSGEDQLYFVYNERGQSLRRKFPEAAVKNRSFGTVLSTLNADGVWGKHRLLAVRDDINYDPLPRRVVFTDQYCLLPAQNHKNLRIGVLKLEGR